MFRTRLARNLARASAASAAGAALFALGSARDVASVAIGARPVPASETSVRLAPDVLELGRRAPDSTTRASVWLVNTSDAEVQLVEAKPACGCITLAPRPDAGSPVAPGGALELPLSVHAPAKHGEAKEARLALLFADGGRLEALVRLVADTPETALPDIPHHELVAAAPGRVALGSLTPGEVRRASVWIVNRSDAVVRVSDVEAGCGCTTVEFEPVELAPGRASEVELAVAAPTKPGRHSKTLEVLVDGAGALSVPLTFEVRAPE